ncbi:hypothetical protein FA048_13540 [Pedobacter polaris]|uniref:Glycosyltransferase family 2 protein n=1 Tax=Pedobacter polaris TaxID=2571273 RepID=A0A4U1CLR1_9SPHI|nr:hypothetical protein [Pedobacter polaris]TKC08176.1 hypothetical protein FA048_13540 [Pedobacter polaris]
MDQNITLQINLSPGDINYAHLTVPALVNQHSSIKRRLLVVDCCKPQQTKLVNPSKKYPEPTYSENVLKIKEIANSLLAKGIVSDIYFIEKGDPLVAITSKKYLRNIVKETHEYGGIGITSYLAGLELCKTRYVLHFDGDMLLYQKPDFVWYEKAIQLLEQNTDCISICPGAAPLNGLKISKPSYDHWSKFKVVTNGFKDEFFSARQFLIDKERLEKMLPILKGPALVETLLVKYLNRGYPRAVENMFFKRFKYAGKYRFMMSADDCWSLHPLNKPIVYINLLPEIILSVNNGVVPEKQLGHENIQLSAWVEFLNKN